MDLDISMFSSRDKSKESFSSNCKDCHRSYHKEWYHKNKKSRIKQIAEREIFVREKLKEHKKALCCLRCGENHPATLDFHHREPNKKEMPVSLMAKNGKSFKTILREIEKCDVLCANCHRILHYDERFDN